MNRPRPLMLMPLQGGAEERVSLILATIVVSNKRPIYRDLKQNQGNNYCGTETLHVFYKKPNKGPVPKVYYLVSYSITNVKNKKIGRP